MPRYPPVQAGALPAHAGRRLATATLALAVLTAACQAVDASAYAVYGASGLNAGDTFGASSCFHPTAVAMIAGRLFSPSSIGINAGDCVVWTNTVSTNHTTTRTANPGPWDSGNMARNATYTRTFNTAGTYAYVCTVHSAMTGTVTVS